MNKKGFTLVELLAVIAILAVLVIIALPNVIEMFNGAKESTFTTELKRIYKAAEEAYVMDSFSSSGKVIYSKCDGCENPLNMDVRDDLEYYIEINSSGKVSKFYAKDKNFQFSHNGDLLLTQIEGVEKIADLKKEDVLEIDPKAFEDVPQYAYMFYEKVYDSSLGIPENEAVYNSYQDLVKNLRSNVFLRVDRNNTSDISIGFIARDKVYYVSKNDSLSSFKKVISEIFTENFSCKISKNGSQCRIANELDIKYTWTSDNILDSVTVTDMASQYKCLFDGKGIVCESPKKEVYKK